MRLPQNISQGILIGQRYGSRWAYPESHEKKKKKENKKWNKIKKQNFSGNIAIAVVVQALQLDLH